MPSRIKLAEMTWYDFADRVTQGDPIVIIPVGSTEQHGPHLPLSTDMILPEEIALRIAAQLDGIVAPPVSYGYKSQPKTGGGNHFPGTVSLDASTLIATLRDLVNEFARHGVRKIVLFDGHMENQWFIVEAVDLALRDQRREGNRDLQVLKIGYWEYINADTEKVLFPEGLLSWALEHAAVMETSVMLHVRPDLVRAELVPDHPAADFPAYDKYPIDPSRIPSDGVLSPARSASAEKGRAVVEQVVPDIVSSIKEAFSS
ncbi:MAG: creatininase [Shinella sp.]|nr:creatininase [Shinella sp.]